MQSKTFRRTALANGIAVALGAAAPATFAQEEVIEEVVVTGIRGSLMQAMDRKRDSAGVVDAITAEDIGKFPDQNLAEALQRITGVSIDRQNNEGALITVRGMGPEFNLVTFNGRSMPTAGNRSFDFSDLATESISAVEIYKTAKADLPTGGIGATVNVITARPLENPGRQLVFSGKAVHETSAGDSQIVDLDTFTPELAAIYSDTFADDTFGIMVSATYQERDNREENADVAFWVPNAQLDGGTVTDNNQRADGTWWHPQNIGYGFNEVSRDRTNGQLVLQYAPTDMITATLDYTYSEVEFLRDGTGFGIWFECPNIDATVNERGTVVEVSQSCGDVATNVNRRNTVKENKSLGFNIDYQFSDSLFFEFDWHDSSSDFGGAGIGGEPGSDANLIIGNTNCSWCGTVAGAGPGTAGILLQTARYPGSGVPTFDVTFQDASGNPQAELLPQDIGSLFGQAFNEQTYNDIMQVQLKGSWENLDSGSLRRINFGLMHQEQEFDARNAESGQLPAGFWNTSAQHWANEGWQTFDPSGLLSDFSGGSNSSLSQVYTAPFQYIVDGYETVGADNFPCCYWPDANFWGPDFQDPSGNRGRFWSGPLGAAGSAIVDEKIQAFYTEFVFEDEFNGMPLNARLGFRYENSEQIAGGFERPATAINWVGGNEFSYTFASSNVFVSSEGDTDYYLPSLDVDLEVYDNMIARFSYSRSIARPPIGELRPTRAFEGNPTLRNRAISAGNPDLLPYVSDNFDLSFEWYYDEGSYASIGYFRKRVDNFLVGRTIETTDPGIPDPYIGALAEQARADLADDGIPVNDQNVFARINENRGAIPGTPVTGQPGDPLTVFRLSRQENGEVASLFGLELALQHMFWESGFGVQANYTIVNGDVDADPDALQQGFTLTGLSDSGNLSVFYENDFVSARLAYNWRDEFLSGTDGFGSPIFTEAYAPLDLNVTWYATDQLAVFFEAINLTEETQRIFIRYPEQLDAANQYGARFNIGARYDFQ